MYTRRYIPPHPDPWTVRPTMYNVRRSCGVHGTPGRRFWRRVGHKVTGSRSPYPSLPSVHRQRIVHRLPLLSRSIAGRIGRVVKVILPGVKATRTSQKQYDFIAIGWDEREAEVVAPVSLSWYLGTRAPGVRQRKLATVSWTGSSVAKETSYGGIKNYLKSLSFQCSKVVVSHFHHDEDSTCRLKITDQCDARKLCVLSYD